MGCGGSKSTVVPVDGNGPSSSSTPGTPGSKHITMEVEGASSETNGIKEPRRPSRAMSINSERIDLPEELLPEEHQNKAPTPRPEGITQSMAFEIPLNNTQTEESLIKKHPPLRLRRLGNPQTPPSLSDLQEKMANAEERRQQILQSRIQSAKTRRKLKKPSNSSESKYEDTNADTQDDERTNTP